MSYIATQAGQRQHSPPLKLSSEPASPPNGREGRRGRRTAVLFLDPRPLTRECVSRWLQANARDLHFLPVADAREAQDAAAGGAKLLVLNAAAAQFVEEDVLDTIDLLRRLLPDLGIIVLSGREDRQHIIEAFRRGVRGYIPTSLPLPEAIEALRFVRAGGTFVPASVLREPVRQQRDEGPVEEAEVGGPRPPQHAADPADAQAAGLAGFTGRESEVLVRLAQGKSNKVIAYEIGVRDGTVKVHVRNIMKKLRATNRTQVALLARHLAEGGG